MIIVYARSCAYARSYTSRLTGLNFKSRGMWNFHATSFVTLHKIYSSSKRIYIYIYICRSLIVSRIFFFFTLLEKRNKNRTSGRITYKQIHDSCREREGERVTLAWLETRRGLSSWLRSYFVKKFLLHLRSFQTQPTFPIQLVQPSRLNFTRDQR